MKRKLFMILGAFSLLCCLNDTNVFANDDEPIIVCHFEENEDGELIEICEEMKPSTFDYCTPECWDI